MVVDFVLHVAVNPDTSALERAIQEAAEDGTLVDGYTVSNESVAVESYNGGYIEWLFRSPVSH